VGDESTASSDSSAQSGETIDSETSGTESQSSGLNPLAACYIFMNDACARVETCDIDEYASTADCKKQFGDLIDTAQEKLKEAGQVVLGAACQSGVDSLTDATCEEVETAITTVSDAFEFWLNK
jgi:hypothetical protein